ncbi:uncharacterized protein TNCV_4242731 [Trichonephila clavipes]|nr:uncharacterized protein TNCV_4242731 [Trichonephila clavipes]
MTPARAYDHDCLFPAVNKESSFVMIWIVVKRFSTGLIVTLITGEKYREILADQNLPIVHDCWQQWSRDGTVSRRLGSRRPRGTSKWENRSNQRTAEARRTASAAEIRASIDTIMTQRTIRCWLLRGQHRARCSVAYIPFTPSHSVCDANRVKSELIGGQSADLLCYLMTTGSARVPMMAVSLSLTKSIPREVLQQDNAQTVERAPWGDSPMKEGDRFNSCQVIHSQFGLAIHQNDHQARRRFVEWAQNEIAVVPDFHKRILFSDEAHFWLNGYVNKQNCRIWSEANPQVYVETPLHPEKLTVWCALWAGGILLQKR